MAAETAARLLSKVNKIYESEFDVSYLANSLLRFAAMYSRENYGERNGTVTI